MIHVIQPGVLTTIQDRGRYGYEQFGMPPSGAFDPYLMQIANKLVGNPLDAPVLEFALIGPTLYFEQESWVSLAAFACEYRLGSEPVSEFTAFHIPAASTLEFVQMHGWFGYLAISGSLQVEPVLGSASTYIAGKLGSKLKKGDVLKSGEATGRYFSVRKTNLGFRATNIISILSALHTDSFSMRERHKLVEDQYRIRVQSNRMGIQLQGESIEHLQLHRSVPALPGSIQITPAGQPIILGKEGPTTGGYPQIAIISRTSWTKLAETLPSQSIRLQWTDAGQARQSFHFRNSIFHTNEIWQQI